MNDRHEQRKPEEIEADIKERRARLEATLGEMEERFSPEKLINSAFDYVRHGGANEFASNLGGSIKTNPTPFLVATVGLGWLFWSQQQNANSHASPNSSDSHREPHSPPSSTASEARVTDGLSSDLPGHGPYGNSAGGSSQTSTAAGLKERAHGVSSGLQDGASRLNHGSRDAMHGASQYTQKAGHQIAEFIREHPITAGALGIAIGATLGGILPSTRTEDQRLGAMRDKAVERIGEEGEHYAERARDRVHEKTEQAREKQADTSHSAASDKGSDSNVAKPKDPVPPLATSPGSAREADEESGLRRSPLDSPSRLPGESTSPDDDNRS